jgi:hypothetical protein
MRQRYTGEVAIKWGLTSGWRREPQMITEFAFSRIITGFFTHLEYIKLVP